MREESLLADRVALITGAASGQGRAAAQLFAAQGATIIVADIDDDGAAETVALVEKNGGRAAAIHTDVSVRVDCDEMVEFAVDEFGAIDVLYNNAAVQMSGTLVDCTEDEWDLTLRTNLNAIFWACRAAIPPMLERGRGSIISTASTLGLIGSPGYAAYGAAKAGLIALTRQIAVEYGPAVRANVIAPGSIDTPRFRKVVDTVDDPDAYFKMLFTHMPLKRLGTPDDIANTALYLASDLSAYTSGAVIPCDGGLAALR